jgi:hypothetical protein
LIWAALRSPRGTGFQAFGAREEERPAALEAPLARPEPWLGDPAVCRCFGHAATMAGMGDHDGQARPGILSSPRPARSRDSLRPGRRRDVLRPAGSKGSILSLGSSGSILSIGSSGSILSIGSAGSILSVGSAGSLASLLSAGSVASVCCVFSAFSRWSVMGWRARGRAPRGGGGRREGAG